MSVPKLLARAGLLVCSIAIGLVACKSGKSSLPETTNSAGITMVSIPAGTFTMGEPAATSPSGQNNPAHPAHAVSVPAFEMGKTEVTVGQYKKFLASLGRDGERELQDTDFLKFNSFGDEAPVLNVDVKSVDAFIAWLNGTAGSGYRLPSEAEWEYACLAGHKARFCGGDDVDELGWHEGNSGQKSHPVAQKTPNAFGLYDMSGNAMEWVADCWGSDYTNAPSDGSAWTGDKGRCEFVVVRGGAWSHMSGAALATRRDRQSPMFNFSSTGFRVARTR
jgi:formylglycine-generating enzyme required for sulfatase activity